MAVGRSQLLKALTARIHRRRRRQLKLNLTERTHLFQNYCTSVCRLLRSSARAELTSRSVLCTPCTTISLERKSRAVTSLMLPPHSDRLVPREQYSDTPEHLLNAPNARHAMDNTVQAGVLAEDFPGHPQFVEGNPEPREAAFLVDVMFTPFIVAMIGGGLGNKVAASLLVSLTSFFVFKMIETVDGEGLYITTFYDTFVPDQRPSAIFILMSKGIALLFLSWNVIIHNQQRR